jgi:hypothetical protein
VLSATVTPSAGACDHPQAIGHSVGAAVSRIASPPPAIRFPLHPRPEVVAHQDQPRRHPAAAQVHRVAPEVSPTNPVAMEIAPSPAGSGLSSRYVPGPEHLRDPPPLAGRRAREHRHDRPGPRRAAGRVGDPDDAAVGRDRRRPALEVEAVGLGQDDLGGVVAGDRVVVARADADDHVVGHQVAGAATVRTRNRQVLPEAPTGCAPVVRQDQVVGRVAGEDAVG